MFGKRVISILAATLIGSGALASSSYAYLDDIIIFEEEDTNSDYDISENSSYIEHEYFIEYKSVEEYDKAVEAAPHTKVRPHAQLWSLDYSAGMLLPKEDFGVYEDPYGGKSYYILSEDAELKEEAQKATEEKDMEDYLSYIEYNNLSKDEFTFQDFLDYREEIRDIVNGGGLTDEFWDEIKQEIEDENAEDAKKKQDFEDRIKAQNLEGKFIRVELNGEDITYRFDEFPEVNSGRTMVPMRAIFESLGATVTWHQETKSITAEKTQNTAKTIVKLKIDDKNAQVVEYGPYNKYLSNSNKVLDVPPTIKNQRTMVPLRFVSEALGAGVLWDNTAKKVLVFDTPYDVMYIQERDRIDRENNLKQNSGISGPLDSIAQPIKVGDLVAKGMFTGKVEKIDGNRIMVFWSGKNYMVPDSEEDIKKWSLLSGGVKYKEYQWVDADSVKLSK